MTRRLVNVLDTPAACTVHRWTYEGSWSRDGAHYQRRCRCGHAETVSRDRFFAAIGLLAIGAEGEAV